MKHFACAIFLVVAVAATSTAQSSNIQSKLAFEIKDLHANYQSIPQYAQLIKAYDALAATANGVYKDAAGEIARGFLTKNRQIISKRPDYVSRIESVEKEGFELLQRIQTAKDPSIDTMTPMEILNMLIFIKDMIEPIVKKEACASARNFYESLYWPSASEIISGSNATPNMSFLGADCN